jgi:hypothetical protein
VLIPTTDLVFYALGSGEYDEMACELIQSIGQHHPRVQTIVWVLQAQR